MLPEEDPTFKKKDNRKFSSIINNEFSDRDVAEVVDHAMFELEVEQAATFVRAFAEELASRTDDTYVVAAALAMVSHEWDHKAGICE